jgi:hypothetical protein
MPMSAWLTLAGTLAAAGAAYAAPVAIPDALELAQCEEQAINVLVNDTETAPEALPLRLVAVNGANLGKAQIVGLDMIHYKAGDKAGAEKLVYIVSNMRNETHSGTVDVTIKEGGSCS